MWMTPLTLTSGRLSEIPEGKTASTRSRFWPIKGSTFGCKGMRPGFKPSASREDLKPRPAAEPPGHSPAFRISEPHPATVFLGERTADMLRSRFLSMAAASVVASAFGCAHCDTCDDFPAPCQGASCGYQPSDVPYPTGPAVPVGTVVGPVSTGPVTRLLPLPIPRRQSRPFRELRCLLSRHSARGPRPRSGPVGSKMVCILAISGGRTHAEVVGLQIALFVFGS